MKFRKLSILVVALILTVALAACGDSPTATSAPVTTAAAATTTVAGGATTTAVAATTKAATTTAANATAATSADSDIPNVSGATAVSVPDTIKSQFSTAGVKNGNVLAYKTADTATNVKTALSDGFKKNGWDDKTSDLSASMGDSLAQMEAVGAFAIGFQKGTKAAAVIGLPGSLAAPLGLDGVGASDTVYIVISGNK